MYGIHAQMYILVHGYWQIVIGNMGNHGKQLVLITPHVPNLKAGRAIAQE
ncbi:hypothetical protein M791_01675 [Neisseria gonorrhoeae MU_NG26]|nr:hypothetical protein T556_05010 [Neisseria gonorrhoeae NG-k51.05]KLS09377.1 hypothetical protein M716_02265 [Neisseria gonorrhoeae SK32402]KLS43130.1 hypothetical protein M720_07625 [Neisseria gonorrhoeae SK39420]KLS57515.1 hypothetical protein M743_05890 [Neisseria gonorrhoeae NYC_2011_05_13]KLS59994.1 hypothetical protein M742_00160 [Neisseria gonorrhoeae NYC_2011_05_07]KLS77173.1 hypothetical protein M771_02195 [Neisseria gonorrhoeae MU_NG1]KLS79951.1 hypothetical protein M786_05865 [Ne